MSQPKTILSIYRWQFGGEYPYDVRVNGVRHPTGGIQQTAQDALDFCAEHYPGNPVSMEIRPRMEKLSKE